jgi:hypothetical protein
MRRRAKATDCFHMSREEEAFLRRWIIGSMLALILVLIWLSNIDPDRPIQSLRTTPTYNVVANAQVLDRTPPR